MPERATRHSARDKLDSSQTPSGRNGAGAVEWGREKVRAIGLKRGGGVALAVRNDFKSSSVDLGACPSFNNINPKIDILVIKIAIQYSNIYEISLYIPPQISVSDYETFVEAIQSLDVLHGSSIFIVGDFNVTSYAAYLDSNISNGFTNSLNALAGFFNAEQYNYVHTENGNLLDLVFSNAICFVEHATDPLVYEDIHHPALIVTAKNLPVDKKNDVLYSNFVGNYNFRKANFQLLYEMIMNVNWANLESMTNVELACELLYSEIYKILDYCVPKVKRIYTHKYPPWYSCHLIQILKQKSVAFRRFKQTGNIRYQVEFQKLCSELKTQASAAYRHYIQSLESDISKNSSTFWSFVNKKTNNHGIPKDMLYNGQSMTNPEDISGAFAEYFGKNEDEAFIIAHQVKYEDPPSFRFFRSTKNLIKQSQNACHVHAGATYKVIYGKVSRYWCLEQQTRPDRFTPLEWQFVAMSKLRISFLHSKR
nr:unnamed protein product [Callosobruchus analis]